MTHPEVERFMLGKFGGTDVCGLELLQIGRSVLNSIGAVVVLGHSSPGSTLDYTRHTGLRHIDIVRDFVAWTSHRKHLAPNCEERQRKFVADSGWVDFQMNCVAEDVGLGIPPALSP